LPKNPNSLWKLRDNALVLIAYDTLARHSELVAYEVNDLLIKHHSQKTYYSLRIKKSKTDQLALGRICPIRFETYQFLNKWLNQANIKEGFLLRGIRGKSHILDSLSREQVNRIMKKLGREAGFPAETVKTMSGHSLRVGAAQDLLASGASIAMIMHRGRWSKSDTVMRYLEQFSELEDL
jgi:integrase